MSFAKILLKKHGVIVDAAIHAPHADGGSDERNYHAHIMFTTRVIDPQTGDFSAKKYRDFSRDSGTKTVSHWRESFADLTNKHLEKAGYDVRVNHRSYKDRGIELEATRHEGYEVTQLRRRGIETEISVSNDLIKQRNAERIQDPQLLKGLEQEILVSEKIVSTLKNERDELNIKMNKINLVEAHERVKNFKADFDAFHDEIENSLPLKEQLQIVEEHDIYNKSKQYLKDIEFLKSQNEKPKTKGLLGAFGFSQPVTVEKVQNVVGVIENIQIRNSRAEANRKRKEEAERTAQAQARREEAERSKKEQSEISEFQNKVTNLAKKCWLF